MKKLLLSIVLATSLALTSCQFDDSDIWGKLDEYGESIKDHEERISALEELCKQMNTNISALQTLVDALEKRDYITNISPIYKDGEEIGYTISFAYSGTITIYHGTNGKDGVDGNDGYTPQIGVAQDTDGFYYWTLDGEWLLDSNGNKIKAVGTDGKDGANGSNGSNGTNGDDGITPRLKIENDYWYVSYDNGATWQQLGKATGEDGKDGNDGANSIITGVDETETEVIFTLSDNTTITIPKHTKTSLVDPNDICSAMDDVKFMEYCYQNFDVNKDGKVSPVEAKSVRNIDINGLEIYSIKGIEYFEILETLIAENTPLRNVDISFNNKLISFNFKNCSSMTSMVLPKGIATITEKAFYGCGKLESIIIPDSVTEIEKYTFYNCNSLTSVTIPNSVTSIGGSAFYNCSNLAIVNISDLSAWCKIDFSGYESNPLYTGAKLYLNNTEVIEVVIPSDITKIKNYAFYNYGSLINVTIPDSITSIENYAFYGCSSLASVAMGNGISSIGDYAFSNCNNLTNAIIPDSVTTIGVSTFRGCNSLTSIIINDSIVSIGGSAFYGCTGELIINNKKLVESSYSSSSGSHPTNGSNGWLYGSQFTTLIIGDNIEKIGNYAFYNFNSLTSVTIPNSVTSIGVDAFCSCSSLTSVSIPDSVTSIGSYAFEYCSSLASVTMGNGVTSLGNRAFTQCKELKEFKGEFASEDGRSLIIGGVLISFAPAGLTQYIVPSSATEIGDYAFYYCSNLTNVTISDSITAIGKYAFCDCSGMTSITIPNSVSSIGDSAFRSCSSLTGITIPDSVTSIGEFAFYGCTGKLTVNCNIPSARQSDYGVFYGSNFTKVTIGSSVTSIGSYAFYGCSKLTSVTISDSVTSIDGCAFYNCSRLIDIIIPNSVTSIGVNAFCSCSSLTNITIPDSVTSIGRSAFSGCSYLRRVYCQAAIPPKGGDDMFYGIASGCKIYVPTASIDAYKTAACWESYASYIVGYDFE